MKKLLINGAILAITLVNISHAETTRTQNVLDRVGKAPNFPIQRVERMPISQINQDPPCDSTQAPRIDSVSVIRAGQEVVIKGFCLIQPNALLSTLDVDFRGIPYQGGAAPLKISFASKETPPKYTLSWTETEIKILMWGNLNPSWKAGTVKLQVHRALPNQGRKYQDSAIVNAQYMP